MNTHQKDSITHARIIDVLVNAGTDQELTVQYANLIYDFLKTVPDNKRVERLSDIARRLERHEPIEYILGYAEFHGLRFAVTPDTLIPRPETESLVDLLCTHIREDLRPGAGVVVHEVGTGTGCISISLAVALSRMPVEADIDIFAYEKSPEALSVAMRNAGDLLSEHGFARTGNANHHFTYTDRETKRKINVSLLESDLLANITVSPTPSSQSHIVWVANLPYIRADDYTKLDDSVRLYEPRSALIGGEHGCELYEDLWQQIDAYLASRTNTCTVSHFYEVDSQNVETFQRKFENVFGTRPTIHSDIYDRPRFLISL